MVSDLTVSNEKWNDGWAVANKVLALSIPLMNRASDLATDDSDAFDGVMDGFAMPKGTDDEKAARRTAIRSATLVAAEVPYETARLALNLLDLLPDLARKGTLNADGRWRRRAFGERCGKRCGVQCRNQPRLAALRDGC